MADISAASDDQLDEPAVLVALAWSGSSPSAEELMDDASAFTKISGQDVRLTPRNPMSTWESYRQAATRLWPTLWLRHQVQRQGPRTPVGIVRSWCGVHTAARPGHRDLVHHVWVSRRPPSPRLGRCHLCAHGSIAA